MKHNIELADPAFRRILYALDFTSNHISGKKPDQFDKLRRRLLKATPGPAKPDVGPAPRKPKALRILVSKSTQALNVLNDGTKLIAKPMSAVNGCQGCFWNKYVAEGYYSCKRPALTTRDFDCCLGSVRADKQDIIWVEV